MPMPIDLRQAARSEAAKTIMPEASKSPGCPDPRAILQCKQTKNPPPRSLGQGFRADGATLISLPAVVPTPTGEADCRAREPHQPLAILTRRSSGIGVGRSWAGRVPVRALLLYCGSCCVPVNCSALHDEYDTPHGSDVVDWIAFDGHQVRLEARRHGSDPVAQAK